MSTAAPIKSDIPLRLKATTSRPRGWLGGRPVAAVILVGCLYASLHLLLLLRDTAAPKMPSGFPIRIPVPVALQHSWGAYRPWFVVAAYRPPPEHCSIVQVNILQRHGARYPTKGSQVGMLAALNKLQSAQTYSHPTLLFLKSYEYNLGTDDLVPFGAEQAKYTGKETFLRYPGLVSQDNLPFVRAAGSPRVINSATNWTLGFAQASKYLYQPKLNVILDESKNCTLENHQCPNAGNADFAVDKWVERYGHPIAQRLNGLAPGSNLTAADIYGLMLICPFESIAHISHSPFCSLFSLAEFASFEYASDLDKYYGTGYGQPLGRVQGVGYINELLARLSGTAVRDHTQTNSTLDADRRTFPLDRGIYVDFSHDNEMIAIYAALGLFPQYEALDPAKMDERRTWIASRMVPFGARMTVEKLVCDVVVENLGDEELGDWQALTQFVRIFVNDEIQRLGFCGADEEDRMCELGAFVESQAYARHDGEGDWEACFSVR